MLSSPIYIALHEDKMWGAALGKWGVVCCVNGCDCDGNTQSPLGWGLPRSSQLLYVSQEKMRGENVIMNHSYRLQELNWIELAQEVGSGFYKSCVDFKRICYLRWETSTAHKCYEVFSGSRDW